MKAPTLLIAFGLTLLPTFLTTAGTAGVSHQTFQKQSDTEDESGGKAHRCGGEPCRAVERGRQAFFDRDLKGLGSNGRACADCHMAADHFQLSPADAEARFQRLQTRRERHPDADDPLFRPIDADDFRTSGSSIRRPTLRRPRRL